MHSSANIVVVVVVVVIVARKKISLRAHTWLLLDSKGGVGVSSVARWR